MDRLDLSKMNHGVMISIFGGPKVAHIQIGPKENGLFGWEMGSALTIIILNQSALRQPS